MIWNAAIFNNIMLLYDKLLSYLFTCIFGIIATLLLFYLTSPPSTSKEIRKKLRSAVLRRFNNDLHRSENIEPTIETFLYTEFDIHPVKSIVLFGTWEPRKDKEWYQWIAVFEPQKQSLLDKLVGRPSFYDIKSFTYMEAPYPDSLTFSKIETKDFDGDGIPEIHATMKSTWADSTSIGPVILRKENEGPWQVLVLPSISAITKQTLQEKYTSRENLRIPGRPFRFFGSAKESNEARPSSVEDFLGYGIYEDNWILKHNGEAVPFVTLRNGGLYQIRTHPIKNYTQIVTLAFFSDGRSTLDSHHCVVTYFKLDTGISRDLLWNWGLPMLSLYPLRPEEINMDEIAAAGIEAHQKGHTFFGYTEFESGRPLNR